MTVREGWPPFEDWQRQLQMKRITKQFVKIKCSIEDFIVAVDSAVESLQRLRVAWGE